MAYDYEEDRREYMDRLRESFYEDYSQNAGISFARSTGRTAKEPSDMQRRPHRRLRLFLAVCLFMGYFAMRQTGAQWNRVSAEKIADQIQKTGSAQSVEECFKALLK